MIELYLGHLYKHEQEGLLELRVHDHRGITHLHGHDLLLNRGATAASISIPPWPGDGTSTDQCMPRDRRQHVMGVDVHEEAIARPHPARTHAWRHLPMGRPLLSVPAVRAIVVGVDLNPEVVTSKHLMRAPRG